MPQPPTVPADERAIRIAEAVRAGDVRAAARLMRDLDDRLADAQQVLRLLWPLTGRAYVVGVTGNPGAGKSTVVDGLIAHYRREGRRVGVVSIDPSSPFSGGALLGDRIRMQRHATDEGVFIRSLATRGHLGGLSRSTSEVVAVLDAMGFDPILVETVGVGQAEVDVVAQADTTVVVTVPGLGDEVQAIKAGLLEVADVLVVNKADREGADRSVRDLMTMLELRRHSGGEPEPVEIIKTVALRGEGIAELAAAIGRHRQRIQPMGEARRRRRAADELRAALLEHIGQRIAQLLRTHADVVEAVAARQVDPFSAAEALVQELVKV
ncbi:MAG: methylmalonyl Co-A mutase-associated GTPase MeaB [Myxococcales bacterium]|nr:methylmalonyl Co-A mutase-associated GTPase MeaB [Myxococcota bacterium]MDW8280203.1 methylmalonyl Co-A mutase-associated GTPase MeaB [Myxococcales bacterium]